MSRCRTYGALAVLAVIVLVPSLGGRAMAADPCAVKAAYDTAKSNDDKATEALQKHLARKPAKTAKELEDARPPYLIAEVELKKAKRLLEEFRTGPAQGMAITRTPLADLQKEEADAAAVLKELQTKTKAMANARQALADNPQIAALEEDKKSVQEPLEKDIAAVMPPGTTLQGAQEILRDKSYQKFDPSKAADSDEVVKNGRALVAAKEVKNDEILRRQQELQGWITQATGAFQGGPNPVNAWDQIRRVGGKLYEEIHAQRESLRGQFVKLHEKENAIADKQKELNPALKKLEEDAPSDELLADATKTSRRARTRLTLHERAADVDKAQKAMDAASAAAGNPADLADLDAKMQAAKTWDADVAAAQQAQQATAAALTAAETDLKTAETDLATALKKSQTEADLAGIDNRINQTKSTFNPKWYDEAKASVIAAAKKNPDDSLNALWKTVKGDKTNDAWKKAANKRVVSAYQDLQKLRERQRLEKIRDGLAGAYPCLDRQADNWPAIKAVKTWIEQINKAIRDKLGVNVAALDLEGLVEVDAGPVPKDFDLGLDGGDAAGAGGDLVLVQPPELKLTELKNSWTADAKAGTAELKLPGVSAKYTWTVPASIPRGGTSIQLTGSPTAQKGTRMAANIGVSGSGVTFDKPRDERGLTVLAESGESQSKSVTVKVTPDPTAREVTIQIGAGYSVEAKYTYRVPEGPKK